MASSQHGTFGLTEAPYHGASHRREAMRAWHPSRGSADRDVVFSLPTLNARSHDLVRNVPVAAAAVLTMITNVVGCGIHPRPRVQADLLGITQEEADDFEHKARVLWELVANSKNIDAERRSTFYQLQDLALRTRLVAGNCFGDTNPSGAFGASIQTFGWGVTANRSKASNVCAMVAIAGPTAALSYLANVDPNVRRALLANGLAEKPSQRKARIAAEAKAGAPAKNARPSQTVRCPAGSAWDGKGCWAKNLKAVSR